MSEAVNYGIATVAAAASQFLLARRAEFSIEENAVYNIASAVTTLVAILWFAKCKNTYYEEQIGCAPSHRDYSVEKGKVEEIKDERKFRDISIILLASHALGWIAGSFASAVFGYNPKHTGSTLIINGAAFGVYMLVLLGTKEIAY